MHLLQILIRHECRLLIRNRMLFTLFGVLLLLILGTLYSGHRRVQIQNRTIDTIHSVQHQQLAYARQLLTQVQAQGGVYNGYIWDDLTFAYNAAQKEPMPYAIKTPFPLQTLSVGQGDLKPFYYRVNPKTIQTLTHQSEIENSFLQFVGSFDFSFVVTYLLPLLIIVFTYNLLSSEKEQGTWVLLKTSNQSIARLMAFKAGFRMCLLLAFLWTFVLGTLLITIGFEAVYTRHTAWIMALVSLYAAFWFSLSFLVNSFSKSSGLNATVLVFIWLSSTVIVPNLLQMGLDYAYPIPSRIIQLQAERKAENQFYQKKGANLSKQLIENPLSMVRTVSVVTPELLYGYGMLVYSKLETLDQASLRERIKREDQLHRQQRALQQWMYTSPALLLQEELSALTGTHFFSYDAFQADVETYRRELLHYFLPKIISRETFHSFTPEDLARIPQFKNRSYQSYDWMNLPLAAFVYVAVIGLCMGVGYTKLLHAER